MPTKIYDKIKVTGISMVSGSATLMPKSLIEQSNLSIWIKWTPQEDEKSNNAAQDDKQQTTTLRWLNHKEKPRSMWKSLI